MCPAALSWCRGIASSVVEKRLKDPDKDRDIYLNGPVTGGGLFGQYLNDILHRQNWRTMLCDCQALLDTQMKHKLVQTSCWPPQKRLALSTRLNSHRAQLQDHSQVPGHSAWIRPLSLQKVINNMTLDNLKKCSDLWLDMDFYTNYLGLEWRVYLKRRCLTQNLKFKTYYL